jgi:hypothetical protein
MLQWSIIDGCLLKRIGFIVPLFTQLLRSKMAVAVGKIDVPGIQGVILDIGKFL